MSCRCGCGGVPAAGKRFVHGHNLEAVNAQLTRDERQKRGATAAARRGPAFWRAFGRLGGRTSKIQRWAALIRLAKTKSPREAVHVAYARGYHAGYIAGRKAASTPKAVA